MYFEYINSYYITADTKPAMALLLPSWPGRDGNAFATGGNRASPGLLLQVEVVSDQQRSSMGGSYCDGISVAEVLFRTAPENQNQQNWTVKFGSVLFGSSNSWSCSVLGSHIWEDVQNRVRTGSNRTFSDIISAENMSSIVLVHLSDWSFSFFLQACEWYRNHE